MHFTFIEPEDSRWTSFLANVEHDVYHRPGYTRLLGRERNVQPAACLGESANGGFLVPLLLEGLPEHLGMQKDLRDARSPDGYPAPILTGNRATAAEILEGFMKFLRDERIVAAFLRTHPLLGVAPRDFEPIGDVIARGRTVPVFLDAPYEDILLRMRQGHRYEIRRAQEKSYRVSIDRWELYPDFVSLYRALMDKVEAAPVYRFSDEYFEGFRGAVDDAAHLVFVESEDDVPAAGALFTYSSGVIQYHLAASDPAFDRDAVQKLAVDGIIRWGLEHDASVVHLGGGVGAENDSLLHFKAGFGRETRLYSTVHLVPDRDAAKRAEIAWRRVHEGVDPEPGFFPPYRSPSPA